MGVRSYARPTPSRVRFRSLTRQIGESRSRQATRFACRLPFHSLTRLKKRPVAWLEDRFARTVVLSRWQREEKPDVSAGSSDPWNREPHQGDHLKSHDETKRDLIGDRRVMAIVRHPLVDNQSNSVLDSERAPKVQQVQSAIGTRGDFDGKVFRDDRVAQHGSSTYNRHDGPRQDRWERYAQDQRQFGQHE